MNKNELVLLIVVYIFLTNPLEAQTRNTLNLSIIQRFHFLQYLKPFRIDSIIPQDNWYNNDEFLKRDNFEDAPSQMFQVHRFNIGAKMARLNGDIPPLSSYYINFDQDYGSMSKNLNLFG